MLQPLKHFVQKNKKVDMITFNPYNKSGNIHLCSKHQLDYFIQKPKSKEFVDTANWAILHSNPGAIITMMFDESFTEEDKDLLVGIIYSGSNEVEDISCLGNIEKPYGIIIKIK